MFSLNFFRIFCFRKRFFLIFLWENINWFFQDFLVVSVSQVASLSNTPRMFNSRRLRKVRVQEENKKQKVKTSLNILHFFRNPRHFYLKLLSFVNINFTNKIVTNYFINNNNNNNNNKNYNYFGFSDQLFANIEIIRYGLDMDMASYNRKTCAQTKQISPNIHLVRG